MLRLCQFPVRCCCCALITKHYSSKISSTPTGVKWRKTIHNVINAPSPRGAKHSSGNLDGLLVQITRCANIHVRVSLPCPDYGGLHHQLEGADLYTDWSSGRSSGIISLASSGNPAGRLSHLAPARRMFSFNADLFCRRRRWIHLKGHKPIHVQRNLHSARSNW